MAKSTRRACNVLSVIAAIVSLAALHGCASGGQPLSMTPGGLPGVTGYTEGNAVMPQGYQVSGGGGGNALRVTVTGSATTPNERLLKIAMARAAQYGAEQNSKTFRAAEPAYSVRCGKTSVSERGATRALSPTDYRVVTIDVTFGKSSSADPADRPTKQTAAALLAEIQAEQIPQETQAALAAQLAQACGRSTP
ncbi:MAG: hypothetical protein B7Y80_14460 [Hyphomicrobium sp. 32-62-53]|nr:MAG: hypothetical protein B7Z29_16015 [Hyphomicrobium sp. 12-62-95]OYX98689.1 MAG: hypothetical protein B7Y80_14460 [Hyphomicrobium sp. 32-62-53]